MCRLKWQRRTIFEWFPMASVTTSHYYLRIIALFVRLHCRMKHIPSRSRKVDLQYVKHCIRPVKLHWPMCLKKNRWYESVRRKCTFIYRINGAEANHETFARRSSFDACISTRGNKNVSRKRCSRRVSTASVGARLDCISVFETSMRFCCLCFFNRTTAYKTDPRAHTVREQEENNPNRGRR